MFEYSKFSNFQDCQNYKISVPRGSNHFLSVKRIKIEKEKVLVVSNCFSQSSLLILIFQCILD